MTLSIRKYVAQILVCNDKGKEFLSKYLEHMLRTRGASRFRRPRPEMCVVERVHRTIRHRLNKYFTYKNTYRYIDVLQQFVKAYNDTVHSTTGIASSRVTDSDVLA